jgi:nicotinamide riboside transporter PnuC
VHAVIGLLLGLGALGVAAQSILVRHWGLIAASVIGLLAMIFASEAGTGFTSTGADSASMAMSVLTGIAMLRYAANLYLLRPGIRRG